jgi:arsenate reductase
MSLTIYHLKACDTCRKAIKALEAAGQELTKVDVRADGVSAEQLTAWVKDHGYAPLLNTRSTTWRGLDEADKQNMSDAKAVALMAEHPTLMKRPVITDGEKTTIGWKAEAQSAWLS